MPEGWLPEDVQAWLFEYAQFIQSGIVAVALLIALAVESVRRER